MNMSYCVLSATPDTQTLAIAYVPMQEADFSAVFSVNEALCNGTIYPELCLPFLGAGGDGK